MVLLNIVINLHNRYIQIVSNVEHCYASTRSAEKLLLLWSIGIKLHA